MKKINSFIRRNRSLSDKEKYLASEILPQYAMKLEDKNSLDRFYDKKAKFAETILEIGFGNGDHILKQALRYPQKLFIGCEPFISGVIKLVREIDIYNINNILIFNDDARLLLEEINNFKFNEIYILFSDPWPKKKHHKRRLINVEFLQFIVTKIIENGKLHIATDHLNYAENILEALDKSNLFKLKNYNLRDFQNFPTDWIKTKYQLKAEKESRKSYYFLATPK